MDKPKGSKGQQTQQRIIEQAIILFSEHGYESTSFQMIADSCEVSQVTPIYHFKSKYGLFEAVVERIQTGYLQFVTQTLKRSDTALERLEKHVAANLDWLNFKRPEAKVLQLLHYFASVNPEFAQLNKEIYEAEHEILAEYLAAGKREGLFAFKEDESLLAELLTQHLIGLRTTIIARPRAKVSQKEYHRRSIMLLHRLTKEAA